MTADEFHRTLDAFEGARYPLDLGAVKVLRFMLWRPEGCDAVITSASFEIRFGWYPVRHRYVLGTAPPVVSELLRLADAAPGTSVRAQIGPATIGTAFPFDRRWLWMDASETTVSVHVRAAAGRDGAPSAAEPLPEPIGFPRRFVDLPTPIPCPHCTKPARRYRQLQGGWLVCPACAQSFVPLT